MLYPFQIFRDLVETGSFTKAASMNHVTQSAVSHHIRSLEERFGQPLLLRDRRSTRPTAAGQKVYAAATEILRRYGELEQTLKRSSTRIEGNIKISTTIAVGLHEVFGPSTLFVKKHPKVHIKFVYAQPPEIYDHILNFQADLGFLAFPSHHPSIKIEMLKKDRFVIIAPWKTSLERAGQDDPAKLFSKPFVALEKGPSRSAIDRLLHSLRIHPKNSHTFDNFESMKQAVALGLGISIVPEGITHSEESTKDRDPGRTLGIPPRHDPPERKLALPRRPGLHGIHSFTQKLTLGQASGLRRSLGPVSQFGGKICRA